MRFFLLGCLAISFYLGPVHPARAVDQQFSIVIGQVVSNGVPSVGAGNLESAGDTDTYTFTAAPGQVVYFDEQSGDSCGTRIRWRCTNASGAVLFDEPMANFNPCGVHDPGNITLTNGGTYTIVVYGAGDGFGAYQFQVWNVTNQFYSLAVGQSVSNGVPAIGAGAIESPGVLDVYTFTAGPGQVVYFDEQSGDSCGTPIRWRCTNASGAVLFDEPMANFNPCGVHDPGNITLTNGGTYTIVVYGAGDGVGAYQFQIWNVTNQFYSLAIGQSVSNGVPASGAGAIESPGVLDVYTFTAGPGQVVYFDEQSGDSCGTPIRWRCTNGSGAVLFDEPMANFNPCGVHDPGNITLTNGGTYTIVVYGAGDGVGAYQFQIWNVTNQFYSLAIGQSVSNGVPASGAGAIESPGVLDVYTFTAGPGQVVYFDEQSGDGCTTPAYWRCSDGSGRVLFDQPLADRGFCGPEDPGLFTLTNGGSYTITVYGVLDRTGTYQFQIWNVTNQQFALALGQNVPAGIPAIGAGKIETPGVQDIYTFSAAAGQTVYFDEQSNDGCLTRVSWRCTTPAGGILFDQPIADRGFCGPADPGLFTLTNSGTFTITVYGQADGTGTYQIKVWPVSNQRFGINLNQTIGYGQPISGAGAIETPGVQDIYTFRAAPGQVVYFDEQSGDGCLSRLSWRCADATGAILFDQPFAHAGFCSPADPGLVTLTNGGSYTLTVYGQADGKGIYQFTVWSVTNQFFNLAIGQGASNGVPALGAGQIETPGVADVYTFTAVAGERVYFDEQSGDACATRLGWRLTSPLGTNLFDQPLADRGFCSPADAGLITLSHAGTYTISVYGLADATGPYAFRLWRESPLIVAQPQSLTRPVGDSATFSVGAESLSPLTYQWRFNGSSIDLATNATFARTDLQAAHAGQYAVVVANAIGSVTSVVAVLTVTTDVPNLATRNLLAPVEAFPGQPIAISWVATNSGNGVARAPWQDAVFLSPTPDGSNGIPAGSFLTGTSLAPNTSRAVEQSLIIPANLSGSYYLVVQTDSANSVAEGHGESNNVSVATQPLRVRAPDLIVSSLSAPASAQFGQSVTIAWTVHNAGTNPAYASWSDQLLLSVDPFPGGDRLLLSLPSAGPLAAGASYSRTQQVTLPLATGLEAGSYFVLAVADALNQQAEVNEGNNGTNRALALALPPLPDLMVTNLSQEFSVTPGGFFDLSWVVTNRGAAGATGVWAETVLVSTDAVPGNDVPLATFLFTNALPPAGFVSRTQQLFYPVDGVAGNLRFVVAVDSYGDVVEERETNNLAMTTDASVVRPWLTLALSSQSAREDGPSIRAAVVRNGSLADSLIVTISNSAPGEIAAPASLIIPTGDSLATFDLKPVRDQVLDGFRDVLITVSAPGFLSDARPLSVADAEVPRLTLRLSTNTLVEGQTLNAIVTRELVTSNELAVFPVTLSDGRLQAPLSVTIPGGAASASFTVGAQQNNAVGPTRRFDVKATAPGHSDSEATMVSILDDDVPLLVVTLSASSVSEAAGPQASMATVTRLPVSANRIVVELENSNPSAASIPGQIIIPPGLAAVSFPVGAIDNATVDGTKQATIVPFVVYPATGEHLRSGTPATLTVRDDDGPTLTVKLARKLVGEGANPATSATVSRSGTTNAALTVNLVSSAAGEAAVPPTVVIPAGQASATFNVASINDGFTDGNQTVTISASAAGFTSGSDTLVVSDASLPDLLVAGINAPASAETEAFVNIGYRVSNQGSTPNGTNFLTRLFLSKDAVVGDDTLLTQFNFNGSIPPGQFFEQTLPVRLPTRAGPYWIVVSTDIENAVPEILENNNSSITVGPIQVAAAYSGTVRTTVDTQPSGTPVPLTGQALRGGVPVPFVPVNIHLNVRGTRRILSALSDANGNFTTTFTPLPTEAGYYEIGAAHPGETNAPVQDSFTLLGMKATVSELPLELFEQVGQTNEIACFNLSDLPLTGLAVSVVSNPANVSVSATLQTNVLGGLQTNRLTLGLFAQNASVPQGTVTLRITSAEGAVLSLPLQVTIAPLVAKLIAEPGALVAGMRRGGQALVEFSVANTGGAPSGPLTVLVPPFPWLHVASANPLPSLAPGASNSVLLQLTPEPELSFGEYTGALVVRGDSASVSVPFTFRAVSAAKGDLVVTATDEYTYYAEGSLRVGGAQVTVRDPVSGAVVTNGVTDTSGAFFVSQLAEGYYDFTVTADRHASFNGRALLRAGVTNQLEAFLSREVVRYIWRVVPTEIEDRTRISIETEFETFVPVPVVTIEPNLIDLATLSAEVTQIDLRIANHGLIAANDFHLAFDGNDNWSFTPLVSDLGTLPANSSLVVPLTIRRLTPYPSQQRTAVLSPAGAVLPGDAAGGSFKAASGGGGDCRVFGGAFWTIICGVVKGYSAPVNLVNAGGDCPPTGGSSSGGQGTVGSPYGSARFFAMPSPCDPNDGDDGDDDDDDDDDDGCEVKEIEYNFEGAVKPLVEAAKTALNGALAFNPYTRSLLGDVELKLKPKGGARTCCDPDGFEFFAEVEGEGEVGIGPGRTEKLPSAPIALPELGAGTTIDLAGEFFFGIQAKPKVTLKAEASTGCDGEPEGKVSLSFDFPITAGVKGEANFKIRPITSTNLEAKAQVIGAVRGGIKFTFSLDLKGNLEECYKSEGIYSQVLVSIPGLVQFAPFTPDSASGKYYFVQPQESGCGGGGGGGGVLSPEARAALLAGMEPALNSLRAAAVQKKMLAAPAALAPADAGGVCAKVRLKLDQDLLLARNAFEATLEVINGDPLYSLSNLTAQVSVLDRNGLPANDRFELRINTFSGITGTNGHGLLAANTTGHASFILVPTRDAAPETNVLYAVGGFLSYVQNGVRVTVPFVPVPITVQPDPLLVVKYFHQRDVFSDDPFTPLIEPSIPYSLAVMIQNKGRGEAKNLRITSAQPEIVENEKGLLIDFKIIGTEVAGQNLTPSLTVNFGRVGGGEISIGRWLLTSTLQGLFNKYSATFEHTAGAADERLSLVDEVTIHEMIRLVQAGGSFEDNRPDFLVNELPDAPLDLPDTLYLSDGTTNRVAVVTDGSVAGTVSPGSLSVQLNATAPAGWFYLRVPDPGTNQFRLRRVVRSDGVQISANTNAWQTDRTFVGTGRRPRRENILHLLDFGGPGSYTLTYEVPTVFDDVPPASRIVALPVESFAQFAVNWSGSDAGSGLAYFDIFVSENGAPFTPWITQTRLNGSVYFGALNNRYAFYSVAVDNVGNREFAPASPDAETRVTRVNHSPVLDAIGDRTIFEGETLTLDAQASDPDGDDLSFSLLGTPPAGLAIGLTSGRITWPTGAGTGPSTNLITVQVLDNGTPRLGVTRTFTVTVLDVNSPPLLAPIPNYTVNEGRLLTVTNIATDLDLPRQTLTFRLGVGAPGGATIGAANGIFSWRPGALLGGSSNRIAVIVSDNGSPSLSATQYFTVKVRDVLPDFVLRLGSTNLQVGATSSIPVLLTSGLELANVTFMLETPVTRLTGFALQGLGPELAAAVLQPIDTHRSQITLLANAGSSLIGSRAIAQLSFTTDTNVHSAVVPLQISNLAARRTDGLAVNLSQGTGGRVFLVGLEPLLDAELFLNGQPRLYLYGRAGESYRLEKNTNLLRSAWTLVQAVRLTNVLETIVLANTGEPGVFYRAVAGNNLAIVSLERLSNGAARIAFAAPPAAYQLEGSSNLLQWFGLATDGFTNAPFEFRDPGAASDPRRFYRIRKVSP